MGSLASGGVHVERQEPLEHAQRWEKRVFDDIPCINLDAQFQRIRHCLTHPLLDCSPRRCYLDVMGSHLLIGGCRFLNRRHRKNKIEIFLKYVLNSDPNRHYRRLIAKSQVGLISCPLVLRRE